MFRNPQKKNLEHSWFFMVFSYGSSGESNLASGHSLSAALDHSHGKSLPPIFLRLWIQQTQQTPKKSPRFFLNIKAPQKPVPGQAPQLHHVLQSSYESHVLRVFARSLGQNPRCHQVPSAIRCDQVPRCSCNVRQEPELPLL